MPIIGGILFFLLIVIIIVIFTGGAISEEKKGGGSCSDDASDSSVSIKGASGAWTQIGTKAYNTAKAIFNFWVKRGMSGAQAAGIVGNIAGAEDPTMKLDQKAYNGDGGGGLYQFTPYTKYLAISDKSWSVESQSKAVLKLEPQTVKSYMSVTKGKSPSFAAEKWEWMYERPAQGPGLKSQPDRQAAAEKAYRMFGGSKFKGKSILKGSSKSAAGSSSDQSGDNSCDDDDAIGTGGPLLSQAKKLLGYFTYGAHTQSGYGGWKHPNKNGQTDCSGFVWLAMKRAGYNVGSDAFFTGTMEADAKGPHKYLKQIKAKDAKPGDVIIMNIGSGTGPNGHTAIIAGKYKGYQTKIIEMGGDNHEHVHTSNIEYSFYSLIHGGARITWARPVKKK